MTVSVLIPYTTGDEHRSRSHAWVLARYAELHPTWEVIEGACEPPWRKGVAVDDAAARATGDVFVIADADLFIDPVILEHAAELAREVPWVVPHTKVFRLNRNASAHTMNGNPRRAPLVRATYKGPAGGGLVALTRAAYDTVHGIDSRFAGWGGEDISFGRALDTLIGPHTRLDGDLFHLWHPPEAPRGRGSRETEALANQYRDADGIPRRMRALVNHEDPGPSPELDRPAVFASTVPRCVVRVAGHVVRFHDHRFQTCDADLAEALRRRTKFEELAA